MSRPYSPDNSTTLEVLAVEVYGEWGASLDRETLNHQIVYVRAVWQFY